MITKPTVLILGAGASEPYGFPVGEKLWEIMCDELKSGRLYDFLINNEFSKNHILDFRKSLFESGKTSVDAFLEHRTDFLNIGKLAMAFVLLGFEEQEILYSSGKGEGKWYKYLFDKMNTNNFEEFGKNKISVITYNYDRSLDQFLFNSLQNSYGKKDGECAKEILKIPIIHLHGRLGFLPWQNGSGRSYQKDNSSEDIKRSAENIKIIHENIDSDPEFLEARQKLIEAARIYILGFGYNEVNIQRIGIRDLSSTDKIIIGTARGFRGKELEDKKKLCNNKVQMPDSFADSLDFLKRFAELN